MPLIAEVTMSNGKIYWVAFKEGTRADQAFQAVSTAISLCTLLETCLVSGAPSPLPFSTCINAGQIVSIKLPKDEVLSQPVGAGLRIPGRVVDAG